MVDLISWDNLDIIANAVQGFAYASPDKNRFIGTPGLDDTMEMIENQLDGRNGWIPDFYDLSRDYFEYRYNGEVLKL